MFNNAFFMNIAYENALLALHSDEVPVGAVIVKDTKIIARAHNLVEKNKNALLYLHSSVIFAYRSALPILFIASSTSRSIKKSTVALNNHAP